MKEYWFGLIAILTMVFLSGCVQQGPSDAELMSKALVQKDPSFCGKVSDLQNRNKCYYDLGLRTLNV